jgi:hypothetical protein
VSLRGEIYRVYHRFAFLHKPDPMELGPFHLAYANILESIRKDKRRYHECQLE